MHFVSSSDIMTTIAAFVGINTEFAEGGESCGRLYLQGLLLPFSSAGRWIFKYFWEIYSDPRFHSLPYGPPLFFAL